MDSRFHSGKRSHNGDPMESNGRKKFRGGEFSRGPPPLRVGPGETLFRVLCVASKIGGVIGKEGSIIKQIRNDTGAKIRIEEGVPGCDERVIVIVAPTSDKKSATADDGEDATVNDEVKKEEEEEEEEGDKIKEEEVKDEKVEEEEEKSTEKPADEEPGSSPAQEALLRVLERILEGESGENAEEPNKTGSVLIRLLVPTSQVGCVLGKAGKIIQEIRTETDTQIRILSKEKVPPCALSSDEVIQITGKDMPALKKAVMAITDRLVKNPPRERDLLAPNRPNQPPSLPNQENYQSRKSSSLVQPPSYPGAGPGGPLDYHSKPPHSGPHMREPPSNLNRKMADEIQFRLICANEKVGSIIGKGGMIIKGIQRDTGAEIKIVEAVPEVNDRVVVITSSMIIEGGLSPAQHALLSVYGRISDRADKETARLLVPDKQVGCLLGKGGKIISEMRKMTRTDIRIFNKDNIPKCASPNDELVQITGDHKPVQDALLNITSRLQDNLFPDKLMVPSGPGLYPEPLPPPPPPVGGPIPPYRGRPEPMSPPRMYSHLGAPMQDIDPTARYSHTVDRPPYERPPYERPSQYDRSQYDRPPQYERPPFDHPPQYDRPQYDRPPYAQALNRPMDLPNKMEKPPSPGPWSMQGMSGAPPRSMVDYGRGIPSRTSLGSGSQSSHVTNSTVEVVIPEKVFGSIYGDKGDNLAQIRQISGAKVNVQNPRTPMGEVKVLISGTPDQTKAAQSLLQAFIISGQSSP